MLHQLFISCAFCFTVKIYNVGNLLWLNLFEKWEILLFIEQLDYGQFILTISVFHIIDNRQF